MNVHFDFKTCRSSGCLKNIGMSKGALIYGVVGNCINPTGPVSQ